MKLWLVLYFGAEAVAAAGPLPMDRDECVQRMMMMPGTSRTISLPMGGSAIEYGRLTCEWAKFRPGPFRRT